MYTQTHIHTHVVVRSLGWDVIMVVWTMKQICFTRTYRPTANNNKQLSCCCDSRVPYIYRPLHGIAMVSMSIYLFNSFKLNSDGCV